MHVRMRRWLEWCQDHRRWFCRALQSRFVPRDYTAFAYKPLGQAVVIRQSMQVIVAAA